MEENMVNSKEVVEVVNEVKDIAVVSSNNSFNMKDVAKEAVIGVAIGSVAIAAWELGMKPLWHKIKRIVGQKKAIRKNKTEDFEDMTIDDIPEIK